VKSYEIVSAFTSPIPPQVSLKLRSDVAADWERFRSERQTYEIAINPDSASGKKRAAVFLACIGSAAHGVFRSFKFQNVADSSNVQAIRVQSASSATCRVNRGLCR